MVEGKCRYTMYDKSIGLWMLSAHTYTCMSILTNWLNNRERRPTDTDGVTNGADPDQTVPFRSSLIWAYDVSPDLSVLKKEKIRNLYVPVMALS